MGNLGWIATIVVGLLAGFIGSKVVNKSGSGVLMDIVIGLIGAVVGGFIARNLLGMDGDSGFWGSLLVAIAGAIIVLVIYNAVARRA